MRPRCISFTITLDGPNAGLESLRLLDAEGMDIAGDAASQKIHVGGSPSLNRMVVLTRPGRALGRARSDLQEDTLVKAPDVLYGLAKASAQYQYPNTHMFKCLTRLSNTQGL
jgi:hypothetical protein